MPYQYSKNLKPIAQELRRNATKEENRLWYDFLRSHECQFRRQKQFGTYIVDFYCSIAKLVIEIDGSQHYLEEAIKYDENRTKYLESLGLSVIRFSNKDIKTNFEGVCSNINTYLKERIAFPSGEGGTAQP